LSDGSGPVRRPDRRLVTQDWDPRSCAANATAAALASLTAPPGEPKHARTAYQDLRGDRPRDVLDEILGDVGEIGVRSAVVRGDAPAVGADEVGRRLYLGLATSTRKP
jgi:hypothetical protein